MTQFKSGDIVTVKNPCSGAIPGNHYILKFIDDNSAKKLITTDNNGDEYCTCQDNWELMNKTKTMPKFKIEDKVKYVSNHYPNSAMNPKWGGNEGNTEGTIIKEGAPNDWSVAWANGEQNCGYKDTDLELINPPKKKKGISNLKAAAKALRKTGPKSWFEAEATIKIKIEVAGTESDAQDEILEEYNNNGMENLIHKQLIITGIQKL